MPKKLGLSTKKSIYSPIEIELNGEVYQSRKFTHPLLIEIAIHEKVIDFVKKDDSEDSEKKVIDLEEEKRDVELEKKKWNAYCNWMQIVFGVEKEELEETEMAEIEDAYMKVKVELLKRQKNRMEKSTNEIKSVVRDVEKITETAVGMKETAKELEKNVKGSGKKP